MGRSTAPQQQQHRILGSQSREKNHIPCGPHSSKFLHVTAKLSETLEKITFTFPRVSLAAGAGAATVPVGSPRSRGWFSGRDLARPQMHDGEMRNIIPQDNACAGGVLGTRSSRLDLPGFCYSPAPQGGCGVHPHEITLRRWIWDAPMAQGSGSASF